MATGVVSLTSDLKRKAWMREGLIQAQSRSFWSPFTGMTSDSVVFQTNKEGATDGHTVVFDFDGNLAQNAKKGKETAVGSGEQKKKFSDKLTVERYRLVADNGDSFDGVDIGDLSLSQHSDSRAKLGDLFTRFKDQAIYDAAQGFKDGIAPTHTIQHDAVTTPLTYEHLVGWELSLRTGTGFKTGTFGSATAASQRAPLQPYRLSNGDAVWLLIVDPFTAAKLKGNTAVGGLMQVMQNADVRGDNNRVIKGMLGKIGALLIVEAGAFFGSTTGTGLNGSSIEISGLRQWDSVNSVWSGEATYASAVYSRNLIMGAGAVQMAFGKQPDYHFQPSPDFGIKSESAVEFWMETKKTKLTAENSDYAAAKRAGLDHGVIALDVKIA